MFKVRREQKAAYREEALHAFERAVVAHVERCFPAQGAELGEASLRRTIRLGIERAAGYGIVAEQDVCRFIDLMLLFGAEFDERCAWAREVLDRERLAGPFAKILRLHERALQELAA